MKETPPFIFLSTSSFLCNFCWNHSFCMFDVPERRIPVHFRVLFSEPRALQGDDLHQVHHAIGQVRRVGGHGPHGWPAAPGRLQRLPPPVLQQPWCTAGQPGSAELRGFQHDSGGGVPQGDCCRFWLPCSSRLLVCWWWWCYSSVQFSSRWYLCAQKSPYVLYPVSQQFPNIAFKRRGGIFAVCDGVLRPDTCAGRCAKPAYVPCSGYLGCDRLLRLFFQNLFLFQS